MASAEPTDSSDQLTCTICHELFSSPKMLPCAHLLCRNCLLSWMQSNKDARCPLCRSPVVEASSGGSGSLEDVVDGLPTDLSMVQLVEAERLLSKQHQCCACANVVATCLCLNCRDMMCKSCAKIHTKFSVSKTHVIEELSNLTAEKLAADDRSAPCSYHTNEVCSLYCPDHDESMCHICAMTRHRSCHELKEMDKKILQARTVLEELVTKLKEGQSAINQGIRELEGHLQDTEKKTQALIQEIDDLCDRLDSAVKECRRYLKEQVHKASSEVKDAVHDGKTHLLQRKGKVMSHKIVTERIQGMKAQKDVPAMTAVMKARVDDMDLSATLPADAKGVSAVTLEISMEAVSSCEKMLKELGEVRCHPADLKVQPQVMLSVPYQTTAWSFHDNHGTNIVLSNNSQTAERPTEFDEYCIAMARDPMERNMLYQTTTWSFHDNHGRNIVLSNNSQTAERQKGLWDGIVMARDPMERNMLYQVEMNEVLSDWDYTVLGVSLQAPHTFSLPAHICDGHPSAVLIDNDRVLNQGTETDSSLGASLYGVREGSHVGLLLDGQSNLHLYVDGTDHGVFASSLPQPCFVTIDLFDYWKKVTTLPLVRVKK